MLMCRGTSSAPSARNAATLAGPELAAAPHEAVYADNLADIHKRHAPGMQIERKEALHEGIDELLHASSLGKGSESLLPVGKQVACAVAKWIRITHGGSDRKGCEVLDLLA